MKSLPMVGAVLGWIGVLVIGTTISATYENKPGDQGYAPAMALSKQDIAPAKNSDDKFHLIMFVHPKCPCSRASMSELRFLLENFPDLKATVYFYRPSGEKPGWEKSDIWNTATASKKIIPKVDVDGQKAHAYRIVTSGQVLLYNATDKLVFSGGITGARGHVGENLGESMIEDLLTRTCTAHIKSMSAPVFGCRILADGTQLCIAKKK